MGHQNDRPVQIRQQRGDAGLNPGNPFAPRRGVIGGEQPVPRAQLGGDGGAGPAGPAAHIHLAQPVIAGRGRAVQRVRDQRRRPRRPPLGRTQHRHARQPHRGQTPAHLPRLRRTLCRQGRILTSLPAMLEVPLCLAMPDDPKRVRVGLHRGLRGMVGHPALCGRGRGRASTAAQAIWTRRRNWGRGERGAGARHPRDRPVSAEGFVCALVPAGCRPRHPCIPAARG